MAASELSKTEQIFNVCLEWHTPCEEEADLYKHVKCDKNPGHQNFIPVDQFSLEHLPAGYRDKDLLDCVRALADITCRVTVKQAKEIDSKRTSEANIKAWGPSTKNKSMFGTGTIYKIEVYDEEGRKSSCLCTECCTKLEPRKKSFAEIEIETAAHVLNEGNVKIQAVCDFFFDRGKQVIECPGVVTLTSTPVVGNVYDEDRVHFIFFTHDLELARKLVRCLKVFTDLEEKIHRKFQIEVAETETNAEDGDGIELVDHKKLKLCAEVTFGEKYRSLNAELNIKYKMGKESFLKEFFKVTDVGMCRVNEIATMIHRVLDIFEGRAINLKAVDHSISLILSMKKICDIMVEETAPETGLLNARFYKCMTEIESQLPASPLWNCRTSEDAVRHLKKTSDNLLKDVTDELQTWKIKLGKNIEKIAKLFGDAFRDKRLFVEASTNTRTQTVLKLNRILDDVIDPILEITNKSCERADIEHVIGAYKDYKDKLLSDTYAAEFVDEADLPRHLHGFEIEDIIQLVQHTIREMFIDLHAFYKNFITLTEIAKHKDLLENGIAEFEKYIDSMHIFAISRDIKYINLFLFYCNLKEKFQSQIEVFNLYMITCFPQNGSSHTFTPEQHKKNEIKNIYYWFTAKLKYQLDVEIFLSLIYINEVIHPMEMTLCNNIIDVLEELNDIISRSPEGQNVLQKQTQSSGTVCTDTDPSVVIIVSHPHGCAKTVSVGRCVLTCLDKDQPFVGYKTPTCKGSSGARVLRVDKRLPFPVHVSSFRGYNFSCSFTS